MRRSQMFSRVSDKQAFGYFLVVSEMFNIFTSPFFSRPVAVIVLRIAEELSTLGSSIPLS